MKRFVNYIVIVLFCLCFNLHAQTSPQIINVMTYNIHHGEGIDGEFNLERIAELILINDIDIVGLQEVDKFIGRSMNLDITSEFANKTNMYYVFGKNIDFDDGEYGNAVLSKFPIVSHENIKLPNFDSGEQRGLLKTRIQLEPGKIISIWNTHFDHRNNDRERIFSVQKIIDETKKMKREPLILLGDFNDSQQSKVTRLFQIHFSDTNQENNPGILTFPSDIPQRKIDYIFIWGKAPGIKTLSTYIINTPASDHLPLIAELEIK